MANTKILKFTVTSLVVVTLIFYPAFLLFSIIKFIFDKIKKNKQQLKNITDEVAVITGGAHGLGRAIAECLARHGCHIAIADVNLELAEETTKLITDKYNVKAKAYKVDVTNYNEVVKLEESVSNDLGTASILVNNAGILMFSNLIKPDVIEVQRMINVNLTSHFWTNRVFLPKMKKMRKGHIVAVSSVAGLLPLVFHPEYTSTKFGVRGLMRCLRQELIMDGHKNITATTVFPYFLKTNTDVLKAIQKTQIDKIYPPIDSDVAAERIVKGILKNEIEIFLPELTSFFQRLFDNLPASMQDTIMTIPKYNFGDRLKMFKRVD